MSDVSRYSPGRTVRPLLNRFGQAGLALLLAIILLPGNGYSEELKPPADSGRRLDLPGQVAPILPYAPPTAEEVARQQNELLDRLFARLHGAKSAEAAAVFQEAVQQLWIRSGSPTVDVLVRQAQKAMAEKQYDSAQTILDTVVDIDPDFAEGWNQRAMLYYLEGEPERSVDALERVLELEPRHFQALLTLGLILHSRRDAEGALDAFRSALEINPFFREAEDALKRLEEEVGQSI